MSMNLPTIPLGATTSLRFKKINSTNARNEKIISPSSNNYAHMRIVSIGDIQQQPKDSQKRKQSLSPGFVYFSRFGVESPQRKKAFIEDLRLPFSESQFQSQGIPNSSLFTSNASAISGQDNVSPLKIENLKRTTSSKSKNSSQQLRQSYTRSFSKSSQIEKNEFPRVRRKSCCCKCCGSEAKKMLKIIDFPFKTEMEMFISAQKISMNVGLKCVAFIGKIRRTTRIIDKAEHAKKLSITSDLGMQESTSLNSDRQNLNVQIASDKRRKTAVETIESSRPQNIQIPKQLGPRSISFSQLMQKSQKLKLFDKMPPPSLSSSSRNSQMSITSFLGEKENGKESFRNPNTSHVFESDNEGFSPLPIDGPRKISIAKFSMHKEQKQYGFHPTTEDSFKIKKESQVKRIVSMIKASDRVGQISKLAILKNECKRASTTEQTNEDKSSITKMSTEGSETIRGSRSSISQLKQQQDNNQFDKNPFFFSSGTLSMKKRTDSGNANSSNSNSIQTLQTEKSLGNLIQEVVFLPLSQMHKFMSSTSRLDVKPNRIAGSQTTKSIRNKDSPSVWIESSKQTPPSNPNARQKSEQNFSGRIQQISKQIDFEEEDYLMSKAVRGDIKLQRIQANKAKDMTFIPQTTRTHDFAQRFVKTSTINGNNNNNNYTQNLNQKTPKHIHSNSDSASPSQLFGLPSFSSNKSRVNQTLKKVKIESDEVDNQLTLPKQFPKTNSPYFQNINQ